MGGGGPAWWERAYARPHDDDVRRGSSSWPRAAHLSEARWQQHAASVSPLARAQQQSGASWLAAIPIPTLRGVQRLQCVAWRRRPAAPPLGRCHHQLRLGVDLVDGALAHGACTRLVRAAAARHMRPSSRAHVMPPADDARPPVVDHRSAAVVHYVCTAQGHAGGLMVDRRGRRVFFGGGRGGRPGCNMPLEPALAG